MTERPIKIRIRSLHKAFGDKKILRGVDLDVAAGSSTVIIGGSGTGKSVLLKHIIGLLAPDDGYVEVDGTRMGELEGEELTRFRRKFGMAFQEGALFDSMTVEDNIAFPLRRIGELDEGAIRERVAECLERVELAGNATKMPADLSGGMRRRVGFARAIAHRPEVLLFDEPTTGLDPVTKLTIDRLMIDLRESLESTLVTISHDMGSVFRIADRVAMLYEGRILTDATPAEIRRSDDPRIADFVRRDLEVWNAEP